MSIALQKEVQDLCANLNDEDAGLIITLIKKITATEQHTNEKVIIGLGKGKLTYPDEFENWNNEVQSMFEGYL